MKHLSLMVVCLALLLPVLGCAPDQVQQPPVEVAATPKPASSPTPAPTPVLLSLSMEGEQIASLNARLCELSYLDADVVSNVFHPDTQAAVSLFQQEHGLADTGLADEATLALLYSDSAKQYIPFSHYAPTVDMSFAELIGDNGIKSYPKGYPAPDTYRIIVDIAHQVTMVYAKDADGEYTVPVRYMLCSTGANDCTPKGTFSMGAYRVRFSQFARDKTYGQYWTQIRKAIYFHTILYTRKDASTYQEEIYQRLGTQDSHGCVRLTVPDARWIWYHIAPGTQCVIRGGDPEDAQTAAIRQQLILAEPPEQRLDLVPGEIPNTDNWAIEAIPCEVPFVQGSQN